MSSFKEEYGPDYRSGRSILRLMIDAIGENIGASSDSVHVISIPHNDEKGKQKAIEAYQKAHPFCDLENSLIVYTVHFSKGDAQRPPEPKKSEKPLAKVDSDKQEPTIEQKETFDIPGPLPRSFEDVAAEEPKRRTLDWLVDSVDGPPEVRNEAKSKLINFNEARRKDRLRNNPHGWMGPT